jgi:hypothetical protein
MGVCGGYAQFSVTAIGTEGSGKLRGLKKSENP